MPFKLSIAIIQSVEAAKNHGIDLSARPLQSDYLSWQLMIFLAIDIWQKNRQIKVQNKNGIQLMFMQEVFNKKLWQFLK